MPRPNPARTRAARELAAQPKHNRRLAARAIPNRLATGLCAAVALGALASVIPAMAPLAQGADDPADEVTVTLDPVTSSSLEPDGVLVLSGTVHNATDRDLRTVQVLPRYSTDPLGSASEVTRVAEDDSFRTGRRDERHFDALSSRLITGEARPFHIELPVTDLGLPQQGVYVVGVDVRATPSGGQRETVAQVRTVMPYLSSSAPAAVPVAFVWPLTERPSMLPDGTLADDALASSLAPEGRLGNLVAVGTQAPVSWLIDPDLVRTARTMAAGYDVQQQGGSVAPGAGRDIANAWLAGLAHAIADRFVGALPLADADVAATVRSDDRRVQDRLHEAVAPRESLGATLSQLPTEAPTVDVTDGLVAPVGGAIDEATARAVTEAGVRTLILDSANLDGTGGSPAGRVQIDDVSLGVVSADALLGNTLALAENPGGDVQIRQRFLSATALRAISAQEAAKDPVPLIAMAPHRWAPTPTGLRTMVDAWTGTPWVRPVGLAEATGADPTPPTVTLDYSDAVEAAELSAGYLHEVAQAHSEISRVSTVLAQPGDAARPYDDALIRGLSAAWRQDEPGGQAFLGAVVVQADRSLAAVRVGVPGELTLSGHTGRFPVTIENGLGDAVRVGLRFTSANPDRLTVPDVPAQVIEPGETAQLLVQARAVANGRVEMAVRPVTGDGMEISAPQNFVIVATNFDTIGWMVVGGAVAVLFAASAFRLVRRGLHARQDPETSTPAPREHQGVQ